ncbi:MAG: methyltransferase domain-containing protein [Desulfovibrio sp.]
MVNDVPYEWIDIQALPRLEQRQPIVLFGAGNGSRELLRYFQEQGLSPRILAVLDNDPTLHGKYFLNIPVLSPAALPSLAPCFVLVTTVSGREAVSQQLAAQGLRRGRNFELVGTFPAARSTGNLRLLLHCLRRQGLSAQGWLLHVGPGGFLGLECGLLSLLGPHGPTGCVSVDAYDFSMQWPDVTVSLPAYLRARTETLTLATEFEHDQNVVAGRWDALFQNHQGQCRLDAQRIELRSPFRFSALPLSDASVALACSFAVLEHVRSPQRAVEELWRVLRSGGAAVLTIITRDHRSFGVVDGYSPISYRKHSPEEWAEINNSKFHQNRLAPFQWRELFEQRGFRLAEYRVLHHYDAPEQELAELHPDFRHWAPERQREVDCCIVAVKP